jgi:hypothetical protein
VAGLEIILKANGVPVEYGSGVAAVQEVYQFHQQHAKHA